MTNEKDIMYKLLQHYKITKIHLEWGIASLDTLD